MALTSSKEFLDIQATYRLWIHSETCMWNDNNIQLDMPEDQDAWCNYDSLSNRLRERRYKKAGIFNNIFKQPIRTGKT